MTLLAGIAARTKTVRLGPACMASFPLRDPVQLAYQWATLDQIAGGRSILVACTGIVPQEGGKVEGKLYGGRVASPRELDDLQKRGADLRRQIATSDERLLSIMEQLEQAATAVGDAEGHLRQVVTARKTLETDLLAERKTLVAHVRQMTAERDQLRAEIDAATIRQYDRLRSTRGGLAVAEVKQRTCLGCRVFLTAAYEQRLRHGDTLVTCQSCGRFLHLVS